jgi:predicted Rossmann fold flavoprotein
VKAHHIAFHERDHGKLFCDESAKNILDMLLSECEKVGVKIQLNSNILSIDKPENNAFVIETTRRLSNQCFLAISLVIASGGLSIPKMCASPFGYKIAEQFGHHVWPTTAGLVPFTLQPEEKARFSVLSGISVECIVSNARVEFRENVLFTHRGLSGPAILQISSYWRPGEAININLLPDIDVKDLLKKRQTTHPNVKLKTVLGEVLPNRLLPVLLGKETADTFLQTIPQTRLREISHKLQNWQLKPNGTEGYRTAEVTLGGVDCDELSSKTMESRKIAGLYFIGEVVDVTGWLGGYNFQWAWSSGWCAGQVV